MTLLDARELSVDFSVGSGFRPRIFRALDKVSLTVARGEILAVVGESGSGKSTLGRVLSRLVQPSEGQVLLDGEDVLEREPKRASLAYRRRVQMVFQDPFASLNPAHTILHHLERPLLLHGKGGGDVRRAASELLERCGLAPAATYLDGHPHRLSGGQRQRVAIARALAPEPELLIADEPTSMLDVSIRTDVLRLLRGLSDERGLGQILITHDLAAARFIADRILVLYAGQMVECGPTDEVIEAPKHPYTQLLLAAAPRVGGSIFAPLPVTGPPDLSRGGPGCPFAARCPHVLEACRTSAPPLRAEATRVARCHLEPDLSPQTVG